MNRSALETSTLERQLLGALLAFGMTAYSPCEEAGLSAGDFCAAPRGALYALIGRRLSNGLPCDVGSMADALNAAADPATYGPAGELQEYQQWTSGNPAYAAVQIRAAGQLRRLRKFGVWAVGQADQPIPDGLRAEFVDGVIAKAEAAIVRLSQASSGTEFRSAGDFVKGYRQRLAALEETGAHPATTTGLGALDQHLAGGFYPGELVILGGRTGMGKTSVACSMLAAQVDAEIGVGAISIEMPGADFVAKCASARSGVPLKTIREMRFPTADHRRRALAGMDYFADAAHFRVNEASRDWSSIRAQICALHARMARGRVPLRVVYVDYLGLVTAGDDATRRQQREQQLSGIVMGLKHLAKRLDIAIVALAQVNREAEKGKSPIPQIHQLRGSGMISQAADVIILSYRHGYYIEGEQEDEIQLRVAKGRSVGKGIARCQWDGACGRVSDWPDGSPYADDYRPAAAAAGGMPRPANRRPWSGEGPSWT